MPLSINLFRASKGGDVEALKRNQRERGAPEAIIDEIVEMDNEWIKCGFEIANMNKEINAKSKEVGAKKKAKENADDLVAEVLRIKAILKEKEDDLAKRELLINQKLRMIGNIVDPEVPRSLTEDDNLEIKVWGERKPQSAARYHHHELLYMIDGYSSERGVAVAGHRAYFLKGAGVLLNQALINYGLSFLAGREYTPLQPPFMMKKDVMAETAQLEQFDEELYKVVSGGDAEDMYLIATSEQPISAYHRQEWIQAADVPLRYAGLSTCFRKEAGSHGRDAWGIFRIHQFEKIEQFVLTAPSESQNEHKKMIEIAEEFYQSLGLAYHVVVIASGALNNAAAKKYDLEAWFPTLGVYRELVSASNCTDYQSRAMETRFGAKKLNQTEKTYVHMLNATLCATERTICCILENYQTETGVVVPPVLRPFMGGIDFMPFKFPPPKQSATVAAVAAKKEQAKAAETQ